MYEHLIAEGMILRSKWSKCQSGSDRDRDCDFYEVIRRSDTHALIREIASESDGCGGSIPLPGSYIAAGMRRKIRHHHGHEYVLIDSMGGGDRAEVYVEPDLHIRRSDVVASYKGTWPEPGGKPQLRLVGA